MAEQAMSLFNFRLDPETREMLAKLARQSERTESAYLRWAIRRDFARQQNPTTPALCEEEQPVNAAG